MCGGAFDIANETVATCEYCGTQQTLPKLSDDRRANLYDRANHFRRNNEFDKAMGIYEQILNEDNTDAESYWSLVLCRYGIEYVEDPATRKRIPTVNRAQFTSIFNDSNYRSALQYADSAQRCIYQQEARAINEIQKGILEISQKEEPFDIFICYKETDRNGRRTPDSVLATELYHQLVREGFKVFFSRITLEDKLGVAYEPYIFAALNSAKVMVVLGTKPEYFNAVWVKNEWSRYLSLIKNGANKILIPAYRDMDPYDLPDEFSHLQAQDMAKLGFMQDLIHGIKKIAKAEEPKVAVVKETVITGAAANTAPLLKRAFMFLEDGEWDRADDFCEQVLNIDPECATAYLGKLMTELRAHTTEALKGQAEPFDDKNNYQKALRFADDDLKEKLRGYIEYINERNEIARKDAILADAKVKMTGEAISNYESAIQLFESIAGWKDADEQISICQRKIEELKVKKEAERLERERRAEISRKIAAQNAKRNRKVAIIALAVICVIIASVIIYNTVISPSIIYNKAVALEEAGNTRVAVVMFSSLRDFKDAREKSYTLWDLHGWRETLSAGEYHTVGLNADGTVVAVGNNDKGQCNVRPWKDIIAISAGYRHTVGLKADGTVVAVGENYEGQCDVENWKDIVAISAGDYHTVGLKADGTVVVTDYVSSILTYYDGAWRPAYDFGQDDIDHWTDIIAVSAGYHHTFGLKADGTVVVTKNTREKDCNKGEGNVKGWANIRVPN
jgi:tetratricopeptide (TPR) repeat protein